MHKTGSGQTRHSHCWHRDAFEKEIQSPREVLLDLGLDGHMCTPGVTLYPLGVGEIWGDNVRSPSVLALLKYPFYPLFNFDNGTNLISKSLTILTSAELLVVFTFAHIFWRYFVFVGFWPILEHRMTRPMITRWHEERRRPKPKQRTEGHDD